jgi:dipeptidyl aminopeptidase/acylaminoacyl peptidase
MMRTCFLLLFSASLLLADAKSKITMTDLLKIRRVTSVEVAPSGDFAIYGVQSVVSEASGSGDEPQYSYQSHLFYINLNDSAAKPVQLTHGKRSDGGATISPDGKQLAFIRVDSTSTPPRPQVWLMPIGGPGEARMLTKLERGVGGVLWRPDAKALLVTSLTPISKIEGKPHFTMDRPQREWFDYDRKFAGASPDGDRAAVQAWLEKNASKDNPTRINRLNFQGEQGLAPEMTIAHLFVVDAEDGKTTQITKDFYSRGNANWSPDGKTIAFVSTPAGNAHPDRVLRSVIGLMDADGTNMRIVLDNPGWAYNSPRFSEDGKSIYITATEADQPGFRQSKLARVDLDSKKITWLATDWQSSVQGLSLANGSVYFSSGWQGGAPLLKVSSRDGKATQVVSGPVGVSAFDAAGGRVVFAEISVPNPNELFVIDRDGRRRQITNLNSGWLAGKEIVMPEEHWITRPDGMKVQYWVMKPAGLENGKKYPVVLEMHGGPSAMWGPGELSMWHEFQLLCAWGYGVVYSNPRGSSGYGYEFQRANFKNWGEGPAGDVLAAFDESLKANSAWMDNNKLFLTGGSYAGYLTAWIIAHDNRFKAAAAQRGVYDLTTFFGEGNAWRLVPTHFGGYPWEPDTRKLLDQQSPFTYASSIRTPFLIMHGSQDLRTGVSQSEMLYKALAQMGRPVEYIRYPNIGHEQTRSGPPLQRMDHMMRIVEFFERYRN